MTSTTNGEPKIVGTRYVLAVKDLKRSAEYYTDQLGFKTLWDGEGWHFLARGMFIVMLGECSNEKAAFETGDHSYFAYIDVENIDTLYKEYLSKQIEMPGQLEDKPWGQREFSVKTIDGHRITFGEKIN